MTQTELALLLGVAKAVLGEQLDELERKRLVRRQPGARDKRVKRLFLTKQGQALADTLAQRFADLRARYASGTNTGWMEPVQGRIQALSDLISEADTQAVLAQLDIPDNLHLLGVLARLLRRRVRAELAAHNLTVSQWRILAKLLEKPQLQQKDLVAELGIAKAPLGKALNGLEQDGWLTRTVSRVDRRAYCLRVTTQGKRRMRAFYKDLAVRLIPLDDFTLATTEQLISDLQALQHSLLNIQES